MECFDFVEFRYAAGNRRAVIRPESVGGVTPRFLKPIEWRVAAALLRLFPLKIYVFRHLAPAIDFMTHEIRIGFGAR